MSFSLICKDEFIGFYKSKVMIFLWVGLPLLALILHLTLPSAQVGTSLTFFTAILVSSIAGLLASVMLAVNIINEKDTRVYDLFLIRPIRRWYLLISKFLAVFVCVSIACILAIAVGLFIDFAQTGTVVTNGLLDNFIMTLSVIAISSSFGIIIGVISPSIVVGVILVIFVGNYISSIPTIILAYKLENAVSLIVLLGVIATAIFLSLAMVVFNRKEF
jgi:ABC-2 type transport system permease protein